MSTKKKISAPKLLLLAVSALILANCKLNHTSSKKLLSGQSSPVLIATECEDGEATPGEISLKKWEASPEGKKVLLGAARLRTEVNSYTSMNAVVTSLSLPAGSQVGFGVMAKVNGAEYIISFATVQIGKVEQLRTLQVGDKIKIRSNVVSYAPGYAYPIIAGDILEKNGTVIYNLPSQDDGC